MKQGKSLVDLAQELESQKSRKKDYLVNTQHVWMKNGYLQIPDPKHPDTGTIITTPTDYCHSQIAARLNIPMQYYRRMQHEAPDLLDTNVNTWFHGAPEQRMLRALIEPLENPNWAGSGVARAFLSRSYRPLDNYDLAEAVLPKISELRCDVHSCELTETRMYIKAVTEKITAEVKRGDVIQAGVVISNSEVGAGSVRVEPLLFRLSCLNGMISVDHSLRKFHVGRGHDATNDVTELFTDRTRALDDAAFFNKVRDVVAAVFDQIKFLEIINRLQRSTQQRIEGDPVKAVEITAKTFQLTGDEQGSVLNHLISGGDLSAYGMMNAVTRASQDVEDYDRATEMERMGGQVIELSPSDWKVIAQAK
jgi:hypothetical protein